MNALLVAIAGAAGALTRYEIGRSIGVRSFPWATLAINLSGSFLLGVVVSLAVKRQWPDTATLPAAVGFLGAYTTFSTFSYESFTLLRTDRATAAIAYVAVSVVGGVVGRRVYARCMHLLRPGRCCAVLPRPENEPVALLNANEAGPNSTVQHVLT